MERARLPAMEGLARLREQSAVSPLLANLSRREIPSLFGLRGMAALAVVIYHYGEQRGIMAHFPGPFVVTLFFELSGLLITWLLLKEWTRGKKSISNSSIPPCAAPVPCLLCRLDSLPHCPEVGPPSFTWAITITPFTKATAR